MHYVIVKPIWHFLSQIFHHKFKEAIVSVKSNCFKRVSSNQMSIVLLLNRIVWLIICLIQREREKKVKQKWMEKKFYLILSEYKPFKKKKKKLFFIALKCEYYIVETESNKFEICVSS